MKKGLFVLMIIVAMTSIGGSLSTAGAISQTERQEHIDVGYYDIWLHADGKTWQKGINPGSAIIHNPTIMIPVDDSKNPVNFTVEFLSDLDKIPGRFLDFSNKTGLVKSFEYLGNGQMKFEIETKLESWGNDGKGFDIKQYGWQMKAVEGWRFYIPVKISWEYQEDIPTSENYEFSAFHKYSMTYKKNPNDDNRTFVFWMFRPIDAAASLNDEFLIRATSWTHEKGFTEFPIKHYKLDKDNPFLLHDFYADYNPLTVVIYRKGIENEKYKYDDVFKNQFFAGYEREHNGEKYYLYDWWINKADGEMMPTKHLFEHFSDDTVQRFLNYFGYTDPEEWTSNIKN